VLDQSGPSWFEIDAAALAAIAFATMPDVDTTGVGDGDIFKWDAATSKLVVYSTASVVETIQDVIGGTLAGGAGITVTYNDGLATVTIDCNIVSIDDLSDVDIVSTPPSSGDALVWDGSNFIPGTPGTPQGLYLGTQVITTTGAGTYTPTPGTSSIIVECQGGGGGGGGSAATGASQAAFGGAGGGGGYCRKRYTSGFSGAAYSVGAKGTGGAAGNNNGTTASDTTFLGMTASGGSRGLGGAVVTPPSARSGGSGGGATGGDINIAGQGGGVSWSSSSGLTVKGPGGSSYFSRGAPAGIAVSAGSAALGYGGGGSGGGSSATSGPAEPGGDGSDGIILIHEYS